MTIASNWTPRRKIVVGFAIVMASVGLGVFSALYVLHGIDGVTQSPAGDARTSTAAGLHAQAVLRDYSRALPSAALKHDTGRAYVRKPVNTAPRRAKAWVPQTFALSSEGDSRNA